MVFASLLLSGVEWVDWWMGGWGHGHPPTFLLEEEVRLATPLSSLCK